jgi:hypothetical protein
MRQYRKAARFQAGYAKVPKITTMNSREAKNFIVQETMQQAALDGVPVSNLERRMM